MNSNENPSPLPQPMRNTCRNCGYGWNENIPFCPQCGAAMAPLANSKASAGILVLFGFGFVVFGAMGACFSMFGFSGGADMLNPLSLVGVTFVGLSLFMLWKLVRGGR
jgi:uncharacterized protein (DUF983 family)